MRSESSHASSCGVGPTGARVAVSHPEAQRARSVRPCSAASLNYRRWLMAYGARRPIAPGSVPRQLRAPELSVLSTAHTVSRCQLESLRMAITPTARGALTEHAWSRQVWPESEVESRARRSGRWCNGIGRCGGSLLFGARRAWLGRSAAHDEMQRRDRGLKRPVERSVEAA